MHFVSDRQGSARQHRERSRKPHVGVFAYRRPKPRGPRQSRHERGPGNDYLYHAGEKRPQLTWAQRSAPLAKFSSKTRPRARDLSLSLPLRERLSPSLHHIHTTLSRRDHDRASTYISECPCPFPTRCYSRQKMFISGRLRYQKLPRHPVLHVRAGESR